jgi:hypothetical protein
MLARYGDGLPSARRALVSALFGAVVFSIWLLDQERGAAVPDAGFFLRSVGSEIGIDFVHRPTALDERIANVAPHVAAVGASVSVSDVNNDGLPDLYFTSSRFGTANALYVNQGDESFQDMAVGAEVAYLNNAGEGASMGSVWGDYDNDGLEDLLVYKYGYLQLFKNLGGLRFRDVTSAAGLRRWMNANGAVWLDYDRDGFLDLYLAAYFRADVDLWNLSTTRIMHNSFEFAGNGGANALFHNLGDGRFEDVSDRMGVGSTRWTLAVAAADFNDDGWPDLYLANDYGPEELYLNQGGDRFELTRAGLETDSKSGMAVALGDVLNRGRNDVFVSNISEPGYLFQGNNLRLNLIPEVDRFEEIARGQVADAGWAWGAQFGDLNNDGWVDLFVVNGFISADTARDYWYAMSKIAGAAGSIFENAANWPAIGNASLSGYERSRVLLNRNGELVDVAADVGVTDRHDGRAVAMLDLFNRGVLDVVVANQGGPALVYRNTPDPANRWIAFKLIGNSSNRSAIGAEVVLVVDGMARRETVDGGMGFASQNDRRVHFGLGRGGKVEHVEIRWPSGIVQRIADPEPDRLHVIREPRR